MPKARRHGGSWYFFSAKYVSSGSSANIGLCLCGWRCILLKHKANALRPSSHVWEFCWGRLRDRWTFCVLESSSRKIPSLSLVARRVWPGLRWSPPTVNLHSTHRLFCGRCSNFALRRGLVWVHLSTPCNCRRKSVLCSCPCRRNGGSSLYRKPMRPAALHRNHKVLLL
jgi:hypothetical protein